MRFRRTAALLAAALLFWALGALVLLVAVGLLFVPRLRRWLRPTWRVVASWGASVVVLVGAVVLVPDGYLPIPPGPGALVTPPYVGRPAMADPISLDLPQHPGLAPNGLSTRHNDGWSSDAYAGPGPLGESPEVDTAWFGVEECATLAFDSAQRLIALCSNLRGPILHVLDPESMRPQTSLELPERGDRNGRLPWGNLCEDSSFFLASSDRAVVATTERRVVVVATSNGEGDPDLTIEAGYDLAGVVPEDDCLVSLMPDWEGQLWYVTQDGRIGTVGPGGKATGLDLTEEIANSFSVGEDGGVYVATVEALYKLGLDRAGQPAVQWRTEYDRGTETKTGQRSQGSGTTPTILPGGLVAITDNAHPRMHVQFYRTDDGSLRCQESVFDDEMSASDSSLVSVGDGVIVENSYGYSGPLSTFLGRTTEGGIARVDVADGECDTVWTSEEVAPTSVAKVSLATGLLYAYTVRRSLLGVTAWYFTAINARTGRTEYSVRTGIGTLFDNHHSAVTLGPDGSAYVATLGGMVRIRDRD